MNQNQLNRHLAINYAILKKLVQDDQAVAKLITRENYTQLLDVQAFYSAHFETAKFVDFFPVVLDLIRRETEAAFARLKPRLRIICRYDKAYPTSILHDLGQEAPLFLYVCGDTDLFERKLPKLHLLTSQGKSDHLIKASLDLLEAFDHAKEVLVLSRQNTLSRLVYQKIHSLSVSSIVLVNAPLTRSIFKSTFYPCNQSKIKHLLISAISPDDTDLDAYQGQTDSLALALCKAGILLGESPADLKLDEVIKLLASHKPLIVPFFTPIKHDLIIALRPDQLRESLDVMLNPNSK